MQKKSPAKTKRVWIWVSVIFIFISVAVGIVGFYLSQRWKPLLDRQLKTLVLKSTNGLYHIEYSNLSLSVIRGNVSISDFRLIPDTAVYLRLKALKKAPDNLYHLSVKRLLLKNFHPKKLFQDEKLNIDHIQINNPKLYIINERQPYNDSLSRAKSKTAYELISPVFSELKIKEVALSNIDFTFLNRNNKIPKKTVLKNLDVKVSDILIDPLSDKDSSRFYYTKNVEVKLKDYRIATPDSMYYFTIKDFAFNAVGDKLELGDVRLSPRYNSASFFEKAGFAKDRFDLNFQRIVLGNIDIHRFIRDQRVFAKSMTVDSATIAVDNNNEYPKEIKDRTGQFPHQQLQKVDLDLRIDTVYVRNTLVSYAEYDRTSKKTGKVFFEKITAKILNVTNDTTALKKNHFTQANVSSLFMGAGLLNTKFVFDLTDKLGKFSYSGTLGKFNGKKLNELTVPLGMVEIQSAKISRMIFNVKADETSAVGNLHFYYNDLKVHVMKREDNGRLKNQGWMSSLANVFIIQNQNPNRQGKFTPGKVRFKRPDTMSFFAYLWQSLFTGIKESVGVSQDREEKLIGTAERIDNVFERFRERRMENQKNKLKRQERREERRRNR